MNAPLAAMLTLLAALSVALVLAGCGGKSSSGGSSTTTTSTTHKHETKPGY